ncbi:hypothetical protein M3Y95_00245600 [Aphelenchoides besseyi]|nr:hypothetical protein M3Y95_00245600 [Aphelenchoides besseyi]
MGKRKGGHGMNPADKERKKQRAQELKRNKKQRTFVRQAIVKGRDAEELLDQLRRLDDQEFDPKCELSKHVIHEKRTKYKSSIIQQLALYRQENDANQVTRLEALLNEYEDDRIRKEEQYQAILFSQDTNLGEIPLPSASILPPPNAAMTPYVPLPPQPPQMRRPILLKRGGSDDHENEKSPPGPPCGAPVDFDAEPDINRSRRVQFLQRVDHSTNDYDIDEDDLGPVEMPDSLMPVKSNFQPVRSLISAPPLQGILHPNMAPPPPQAPVFSRYVEPQRRPLPTQPMDNKTATAATVISAEPQMRNLKKEATRFMPTALQVTRPSTTKPKAFIPNSLVPNRLTTKSTAKPSKSADEACDEFLREIQDLF